MRITSSRWLTSGAAALAAAALVLGGTVSASAAPETASSDPRPAPLPPSPDARAAIRIVTDYVTDHPRPVPPSYGDEQAWNAYIEADHEYLSGFPWAAGIAQWDCKLTGTPIVSLVPATDTSRAALVVMVGKNCGTFYSPNTLQILSPRLPQ